MTDIAPNGLPLTVIRADGTRLEHEHAAHPSYMFPVEVEYTGTIPADLPDWDVDSYRPETHALIYADGTAALTLYECCYYLWRMDDGSCLRSPWSARDWRLTEAARAEIARRTA